MEVSNLILEKENTKKFIDIQQKELMELSEKAEKLMKERQDMKESLKGGPGEKIDNAIKSTLFGSIIGSAFGDEQSIANLNAKMKDMNDNINTNIDILENVKTKPIKFIPNT